MAPLACQLIISVFLLTFLQEFHIVSSQRRYSEVGDPFGGVRYSNSRVASTVTRRYPIGTNATERPIAAYVQTTPVPSPYWTTATTTQSPTDDDDDDALWYASSSTDTTTTTTEKPRRRTQRKKADRETLADWRSRFSGTWAGTQSRRKQTSTTSDYTPIEQGSYYDRPTSSAAPAKLVDVSEKPVFNWEGKRHRHRHGHGQRVGPDATAEQERGQEFKARTATTYTTPLPTTTTTTTARPTTTRTYVRPSTVDPAKTRGSVWYHNKQDKPPVTHRRLSESVTYVSGSYFPHSDRLRRPLTGFFRSKNELPDVVDNASPPPEILTYPTTRTRTIRIRYFPGDHGRSGTRNQDQDRDDSVHPFASVYGK